MDKATHRVKKGLAEMLKGGVIMDVTTPEQATIAEDAGAVSVMALERVPADIRAAGGREHTLGEEQALALYPANSIFVDGYLTTPGQASSEARAMVERLGFRLEEPIADS